MAFDAMDGVAAGENLWPACEQATPAHRMPQSEMAPTPGSPVLVADQAATTLLAELDQQVSQVVLDRQDPITGLLPASTANTVHGNYGDAWVRDGVYSIQCVWGLALAYRRQFGACRRAFELEQRVLQLMRGLMNAMLRQAAKVERFKHSLDRGDALHAKYDTATGAPVVPDDGWGHLQLDATAVFLLQLAQLTRSGLVVVRSAHERDFVQNLVYYVARAYRVADYGIWERGDKGNHGLPERNASSIGMVKAALEALEDLDLFGPHGDGSCCLVIPHDAIVRLRRALQGLLPRESASKEVDAACLSVIGYPAWAVEDRELAERTRNKIRAELGGAYGYKRFRRDGHQTVVEDHTRLHYEREELAQFEHIECEWPLFWAYELVTACCQERWQEARQWRGRLASVSVVQDGVPLLPELYLVPPEAVERERRQPGSQPRQPNDNVPLLWTQSLTWLGDLLLAGLITPADLDPSGRRLPPPPRAERVLVGLVPGSAAVAEALRTAGLPTSGSLGGSAPEEAASGPIVIQGSEALAQRLAQVGANRRLGLTGHPPVRMETLATARLYRCPQPGGGEELLAFVPSVLEEGTFYLADDAELQVDTVQAELRMLQRQWRGSGSPLLLIPVAEAAFQSDPAPFLSLGAQLLAGEVGGVPVALASLDQLAGQAHWVTLPALAAADQPDAPRSTVPLQASSRQAPLSAAEEQELERDDLSIAELADRLWQSTSLEEQAEVLEQLVRRLGSEALLQGPGQEQPVPLRRLLEEVYHRALGEADWDVVRRTAGWLALVHPQLEDALTDLLVRQRQVVVGRNYTTESLLTEPQGSAAIAAMIRRFSGEDSREWMLQQELLLALDGLARHEPRLLSGSLTLQVGQLLLLLTSELAAEADLTPSEAFEALCAQPPHAIRRRLQALMADVEHAKDSLKRKEQLHVSGRVHWSVPPPLEDLPSGESWLQHRVRLGALGQVPRDFYAGVWELLHHCRGIVIGDKLERRNRLASAPLLSEKTPGEKNFAALVEHLLSKIEAPEYRQLCTETLVTLMAFVGANPQVRFEDDLALDVVIGHAVRVGWQLCHPQIPPEAYTLHKAAAWEAFYNASPAACRRWQLEALRQLTLEED
ncbi:phosphorylase kinase alpha subunit [Cyanobium sp. PCC 7001]|nr:phosphorylase kinase alpha subunit [Cyanobium sp. PCC 7001]